MPRFALDFFAHRLEAAYLTDPFHAFRVNLESVHPSEWDVRPSNPSIGPGSEFGPEPELSICDLTVHVAGAKQMYANRMFGDGSLEWDHIRPPSRQMSAVLIWLDENHRALVDGLARLEDDAELGAERLFPYRGPQPVGRLLSIVINHDLYHSGEINRQRALIRGSDGWER